MDIRLYFAPKGVSKNESNVSKIGSNLRKSKTKTKKRSIISSDEEEEKKTSPVKRRKVAKKTGRARISSDSDDDVRVVGEKKALISQSVPKEPEPKIISPLDVFGKAIAKRVEAPKITKKLQKEEAKVHREDDDFEATLNALDTSEIERQYSEESTNGTKKKEDRPVDGASEGQEFRKEKSIDKENSKEGKRALADGRSEKPVKAEIEKDGANSSAEIHAKHGQKRKTGEAKRDDKHEGAKERRKSSSSSTEKKTRTESHGKPGSKSIVPSKKATSEIEVERKKPSEKGDRKTLDPFEERIEKKKQSAALYQQYLNRGGARNPGSKTIPEGAEFCLAGLSFLITGVLDSLEREEAEELVKKYGGRVLHQVTKKTDYVILGDQPGPAKLSKAKSLGIKVISEDELLDLIRTRHAGRASDVEQSHAKSGAKRARTVSPIPEPIEAPTKAPLPRMKETEGAPKTEKSPKSSTTDVDGSAMSLKNEDQPASRVNVSGGTEALVEKYRPKSMKQIVGQQGNRSSANKLFEWLKNWHQNQSGSVKRSKPNPWAKNDDGAFFKAALLSGPPGVGKTTTVQVACKELGMDPLEFNASDTRSKRLLKEGVSELLNNTSMKGYFTGDRKTKPSANHVLVMDEVDGMAGNEDRGGLQELIGLIKSSDVPVICICNDRNDPKMRTLSNYTFDLRFPKPRVEQIRAAMMSMCYKENIKITAEDLNRLIEATNQDIRQVINHLALLGANSEHRKEAGGNGSRKDLKLTPWDVVRKVFSAAEHEKMSLNDRSDLFFHDYSIAPLFVQENYLSVAPKAPKGEVLDRIAQTAESLAMGDIVEKAIRGSGAWSLLPMQACYSSVIPGALMSGRITEQINFPSWLGRNSKRGKFDRLLQELTTHARLATCASKESVNLDYLSHIRDAFVRPLIAHGAEGITEALDVANNYHFSREDLDSLVEVSLWPGQKNLYQAVDSKVKAAFTRAYNKSSMMLPYAVNTGTTTKKKAAATASRDDDFVQGLEDAEGEGASDSDEDDDVESLKVKKPAAGTKTTSAAKTAAGAGKRGKGRGGRGK